MLLGIYPDDTLIRKDTCTPMFIIALLNASQDVEAKDEWIKKMFIAHLLYPYICSVQFSHTVMSDSL